MTKSAKDFWCNQAFLLGLAFALRRAKPPSGGQYLFFCQPSVVIYVSRLADLETAYFLLRFSPLWDDSSKYLVDHGKLCLLNMDTIPHINRNSLINNGYETDSALPVWHYYDVPR
jgi:hypothetical protein